MSNIVSAKGWPNFLLTGTVFYEYPAYAIRDSYESIWEMRPRVQTVANEEDESSSSSLKEEAVEWQRVTTVTFHVDVNTASTATDLFFDYMLQRFLRDVVLALGRPDGKVTVKHLGSWRIQRIAVEDHGNGCSRVTTVAEQRGDWVL